ASLIDTGPFGDSCRARCINQIGQIFCHDLTHRIARWLVWLPLPMDIQTGHATSSNRKYWYRVALSEYNRDLSIFEYVGEAVWRKPRIKGNIGSSGFENGQQCSHQF